MNSVDDSRCLNLKNRNFGTSDVATPLDEKREGQKDDVCVAWLGSRYLALPGVAGFEPKVHPTVSFS